MKRGLTGLAVALSITVMAGIAVAHTSVAETTPVDGSKVEAAPSEVHIRFGQPEIPAPGQITDGRLEVYDACGTRVDNSDTVVSMQDSSMTVTSGGTTSGRYEAHWFATAADGATQAGVFDFEVTGGGPCVNVVREDPAGDVDLGFDVVKLQSKRVDRGVKMTTSLASPVTCKALKDEDTELVARFDTNSDRLDDVSGRFGCEAGAVKLVFEDGQSLNVRKPTPTTLSTVVPRHVLLGTVDVFLRSITDKDECSEKVCAEIAPDLGLLTVYGR